MTPRTVHILHSSSLVEIRDVLCCEPRSSCSDEEEVPQFNFVLPIRGAFRWHVGSHQPLIDCNVVALFSPRVTHRISHPLDCGDRCLSMRCSADVVYDAFGSDEIDPQHWALIGERARNVRRLVYEILSAEEHMTRDEAALALIDALATQSAMATTLSPTRRVIDKVREHIHERLVDKDTLQTIASAVGYSAFHLARSFRAQTGITIHQYRQNARLAQSLERLRFSDEPISDIAVDLGFYDHSHFAAAFMRAFGATPSSIRGSMYGCRRSS